MSSNDPWGVATPWGSGGESVGGAWCAPGGMHEAVLWGMCGAGCRADGGSEARSVARPAGLVGFAVNRSAGQPAGRHIHGVVARSVGG